MTKTLHSDILSQLQSEQATVICLIESSWGSGKLYLTNFARNINWNDNEYIALGHLLAIDEIEENLSLQATNGSITLSGLPENIKSLALEEEFANRSIKIYCAVLSQEGTIIHEPFLVQEGLMNGLNITDNIKEGTITIQVNYSNHLARFEDTNNRKSNPNEHKRLFPYDEIFDSVPHLADQILEW